MKSSTVQRSERRRGFASIMAVALIGLVAMTLMAMTALLTTSYRRTQRESTDAQLRQILLAGSTAVIEQSRQWEQAPAAGKTPIALPDSLRPLEAAGDIQILPKSADSMEVQITARLGKRISHQTLHWSRSGNRWNVDSATIRP